MNEVARPAPVVTDDSDGFWSAAAEGRLVAQRCTGCGRLHHPPRPMCPACGATEHDWVDLSGRGTVYSFSILHHPRHPAFDYPVVAVLVDLDEGVRLLSSLTEVEPEGVRIGMSVEVTFEPRPGGGAVPLFRPAALR